MPLQTDKLTPLESAKNRASKFAMNLLLSAALNETLNAIEDMRLEGQQLLKGFRGSEGSKKEEFKTAISLNIQDRKFLLETVFLNAIEKDV